MSGNSNPVLVENLLQRLDETASALQAAEVSGWAAATDIPSGVPSLLRQAQAELGRSSAEVEGLKKAHAECERSLRLAEERQQAAGILISEASLANNLLRTLLDTLPVGMIVCDADGALLMTSRPAQAILGSPVIGDAHHPQRDYTPLHPDGSPFPSEDMPLVRALEHGETIRDVEILIRRADGSECTILAGAAPVRDEAGGIVSGVTVFQDITERKQAEEMLEQRVRERTAELAQANAYNRSLIEASLDPLVTIGPDGRITDVNAATEAATGRTREELVGADFSDYFTEPEKARAGYQQVFDEGFVRDYPLEIRRQDGHVTPVLYNASVYRDEGGEVIGVFAAARDITERTRAEKVVGAERKRFNDILEMLPAYLVLLSPDHHVPFANRFFRERFGESHGRRCFEYLFGRSEPCETCESYKSLETGAPHHWEWTGPDGRNYDIYDFPFTDSDGSPLIMEMGIDITERKRAEEALKEANETLERRVQERTAELAGLVEELEAAKEELRQQNEALEVAHAEAENGRRRLEAVMEALPVGVAITDVHGGNIQSNSAYESVWGSPRLAARSISDYEAYQAWWADSGEAVAPEEWASAQAVRKGEAVVGQLFEIQRFDGSRAFVINSASPVRDAGGNVVGSAVAIHDITDLRRAEQALRESEERFRSLYVSMTEGVALHEIVYDSRGQAVDYVILDVNPAYETITGLSRERTMGSKASELYGAGQPPYIEIYDKVAASGEPVSFETYFAPMEKHFSISIFSPHKGRFATVFSDITERVRTEEALRESEARYRELFDTSHDGLVFTDLEGRYLECNSAYLDLLGYETLEELRGKSYEELTPPEYYPLEMRIIQEQTLARGYCDEYEKEYIRKTGERIPVSLKAWLRLGTDRKPVGMWVIVRDITVHKQAEEALQHERNILHTIMENTRAHLAYLDPEFNFVAANSTYVQGCGYSREELIGHNHFALFPHAENQAIFEQVRDTGELIEFHAKPFEFPDQPELGTTYWDWTLAPVKGTDSQVEGLVLSLMDVTQQIRAQAEIESLSRFPRENPNPVLRVAGDGTVLYANPGSAPLLAQWSTQVGQQAPEEWQRYVAGTLDTGAGQVVEESCNGRTFSLTIAPLTEKGYANLYGLDITDLETAQQALRRHAERLRGLHEVDQAILAARSVEEIAGAALQRTPQLLDCLRTCITLVDLEAREMSLLAACSGGEIALDRDWRATIDDEWARALEIMAGGAAYFVEDVQQMPPVSEWWRTLQAEGVRAFVATPLIIEGALIGSLNLGMHRPGPLTADQMEIARELAIQAAIGIRQARLHEHVQRHAYELEEEVQKRTRALRASEVRFRAIFEGAGIGIALVDGKGRVEESNPALQELLGYGAEELRGKPFTDFSHPDDVPADEAFYEELMAQKGGFGRFRLERRFIRRDGRLCWASVTASLVQEHRRKKFTIIMIEDVTEQKRTQEALVQSEKLAVTGRLAASLAHEINNPLQSVIGSLELVEESLAEGKDAGQFLQLATRELERVVSIVGQLRDLSRPSQPEERKSTDVAALVDYVLALTRKQYQKQGVEVAWEAASDLPSLMLVPDRIQQVFLNLTLNAVEAMPEGGRLEVRASPTNDPEGVSISFMDSGEGIASDTASHLFEPFYTTKPDGLGLGLYVTHNIVEEHGGHIEVEGREGEGATFTVWLPA